MGIARKHLADSANRFADNEMRKGVWEVWPEYVMAGPLHDPDAERHIRARSGPLVDGEGEVYEPLVQYPGLFLLFARLADDGGLDEEPDTRKNRDVALEWAHSYGVLGLTRAEHGGRLAVSTEGGPKDTVEAFAREAWCAHNALTLYEAATAPGGPDVEIIEPYIPLGYRAFFTRTPRTASAWALGSVADIVQQKVAGNVYPAFYGNTNKLVQGWDFRNLLGAMWFQMFFLLTATEQPRRCRNWECNRIINIESPEKPVSGMKRNDRGGGYRTRKDKGFCSKKCHNHYTYLTSTKPKRQAR